MLAVDLTYLKKMVMGLDGLSVDVHSYLFISIYIYIYIHT